MTLYGKVRAEWTAYHPPKSAMFGHRARRRDPVRAWAMTAAFLDRHCVYRLSPSGIVLKSWGPGPLTRPAAAEDGLNRASGRFGPPEPSGDGSGRWVLAPSDLEDGLTLCAGVNRAWPEEQIGPLTLTWTYTLVWRRWLPSDGAAVEEDTDLRNGASLLGVGIWSQALLLQPNFMFPLPWDSPELRAYLAELDPVCPFRFRDRYFHRLLPSREGTLTRSRRLPKGWRSGTEAP